MGAGTTLPSVDDPKPRITYDPVADAAYIYLRGDIPYGAVARSRLVPIESKGSSIIVSYDDSGNALGIEFLGCSRQFTPEMIEALSTAETP